MGAKSDLTHGQVHMQVCESTILAVNMSCMTKSQIGLVHDKVVSSPDPTLSRGETVW